MADGTRFRSTGSFIETHGNDFLDHLRALKRYWNSGQSHPLPETWEDLSQKLVAAPLYAVELSKILTQSHKNIVASQITSKGRAKAAEQPQIAPWIEGRVRNQNADMARAEVAQTETFLREMDRAFEGAEPTAEPIEKARLFGFKSLAEARVAYDIASLWISTDPKGHTIPHQLRDEAIQEEALAAKQRNFEIISSPVQNGDAFDALKSFLGQAGYRHSWNDWPDFQNDLRQNPALIAPVRRAIKEGGKTFKATVFSEATPGQTPWLNPDEKAKNETLLRVMRDVMNSNTAEGDIKAAGFKNAEEALALYEIATLLENAKSHQYPHLFREGAVAKRVDGYEAEEQAGRLAAVARVLTPSPRGHHAIEGIHDRGKTNIEKKITLNDGTVARLLAEDDEDIAFSLICDLAKAGGYRGKELKSFTDIAALDDAGLNNLHWSITQGFKAEQSHKLSGAPITETGNFHPQLRHEQAADNLVQAFLSRTNDIKARRTKSGRTFMLLAELYTGYDGDCSRDFVRNNEKRLERSNRLAWLADTPLGRVASGFNAWQHRARRAHHSTKRLNNTSERGFFDRVSDALYHRSITGIPSLVVHHGILKPLGALSRGAGGAMGAATSYLDIQYKSLIDFSLERKKFMRNPDNTFGEKASRFPLFAATQPVRHWHRGHASKRTPMGRLFHDVIAYPLVRLPYGLVVEPLSRPFRKDPVGALINSALFAALFAAAAAHYAPAPAETSEITRTSDRQTASVSERLDVATPGVEAVAAPIFAATPPAPAPSLAEAAPAPAVPAMEIAALQAPEIVDVTPEIDRSPDKAPVETITLVAAAVEAAKEESAPPPVVTAEPDDSFKALTGEAGNGEPAFAPAPRPRPASATKQDPRAVFVADAPAPRRKPAGSAGAETLAASAVYARPPSTGVTEMARLAFDNPTAYKARFAGMDLGERINYCQTPIDYTMTYDFSSAEGRLKVPACFDTDIDNIAAATNAVVRATMYLTGESPAGGWMQPDYDEAETLLREAHAKNPTLFRDADPVFMEALALLKDTGRGYDIGGNQGAPSLALAA